MSEHFDEQISEFIDDEMSPEQCEFFVRRLQRDEGARARYMRYQLIGAAVRGEHIQQNAPELRRRLEAALASDAAAPVAAKRADRGHQLVASAGIAAGFVLFAAIGWGVASLDRLPPADAGAIALAASDAPSIAAMLSPLEGGNFAGQMWVIHAGYSSGFNRAQIQSNILAAEDVASAVPEADAFE
jgi:hypothetical protein